MEFYLKENGVRTQLEYGELDISGNEDYGYRPFQLMIASIAGCSASVFRKILTKKKIEIEDLHITAEAERDAEHANKITKISLHFIVKGENLDKGKLEKSLELAKKNCTMVQSVKGSIEVVETLELINLSN
ncbi:OsmC family protein [Saliterribacillus persicus]|uniref:Putative OsmC-like protein n=1 Tax=Saliterribacillus persicus TaxID=930114 RepID=A0A368X4P2_9BACI|nr:OsmC family protein [Saliterribacillus persicus]RCW62992.1 putative OsmC-like protein [Saliterribacillus persicus]